LVAAEMISPRTSGDNWARPRPLQAVGNQQFTEKEMMWPKNIKGTVSPD
jgi:hypothetical protein